jgi:hypothetical protein
MLYKGQSLLGLELSLHKTVPRFPMHDACLLEILPTKGCEVLVKNLGYLWQVCCLARFDKVAPSRD